MNNAYFFTGSISVEQNGQNLKRAHQRAEARARAHGSGFSPGKYQLIHFTHSGAKFNVAQTVRIQDTEVKPTKSATYMGITLDPTLRWEDRIRYVQKKATPLLGPLGGRKHVGDKSDTVVRLQSTLSHRRQPPTTAWN